MVEFGKEKKSMKKNGENFLKNSYFSEKTNQKTENKLGYIQQQ